jgi:hypothetical protein
MIRGLAGLPLLLAAALAAAQPAPSASGNGQPDAPVIRLTIRPAREPSPALKYRFLPELAERTPGNAALNYHRAALMVRERRLGQKEYEQIERWLETPAARLTPDDLRKMTAGNREILKEVALGARMTGCDWGLDFRKEGIGLLLPEVQIVRDVIKTVALEARAQVARGQLDQAARTLQSGFALAKNTGEGSTLLQALVGLALTSVMANEVQEFIQAPESPNLYWALTALPRPFIDMRKPYEGEKDTIFKTFPVLRDIETAVLSPEQVREQMLNGLRETGGPEASGADDGQYRLMLTGLALKLYPEAKRALIAQGRKPAEVEAMPVLQVVAIHSLHQYRALQDELFKWTYLPYPQAREGFLRAEERLREARSRMEAVPFTLLVPTLIRVNAAAARVDRQIAALRCIEAIRLYAAAHDRKLPDSLADIKEVPVPPDPMTGKNFEYRASGDTARLYGPPPSGEQPADNNTLDYRLTLKRF